MTPSPIIFWPV